MILSVELSLIAGLLIGLLGGGGSLLLVPILLYVAHVSSAEALQASLLVVALTSVSAMVQHARRGAVMWRSGLCFVLSGALGSYAGSQLSHHIPQSILMLLFAALVFAAAISMLRGRSDEVSAQPASLEKLLLLGALVGVVTGVLGAGGGFLLVPVLARFAGLRMPQAIGTSLFIITVNSLVALLGHLRIGLTLPAITLYIAISAIAGAFIGASMSQKISADKLRRAFAWFLIAVSLFLVMQQLPASWLLAMQGRWPAALGGLAIGGFVLLFLYFQNQALGVSTGYLDVCQTVMTKQKLSWRMPFMLGIIAGGTLAALLSGGLSLSLSAGIYDLLASSFLAKGMLFLFGGVLVGYGARVAGGCTSGHSIVGIAQLAPSSLLATLGFMLSGFVLTNLLFRAFGGVA